MASRHGRPPGSLLGALPLVLCAYLCTLATAPAQVTPPSTVVDLKGVAYMEFAPERPMRIGSFANVEQGKLYTLRFLNDNTTVSREGAYTENGEPVCPVRGQTLVFYGEYGFLRQLTRATSARSAITPRPARRIEDAQPVDLECADTVEFALKTPGTITSFRNVNQGKIYTFRFANENTTISRNNAYLADEGLLTPARGATLVFVGHGNSVRQVTRAASDVPPDNAARATTRRIDQPEPVDLEGITTVEFALSEPGTIRFFRNVERGRIYTFRFANGNATISRDDAYLRGGVPLTPPAGSAVVFTGERHSTIRQVTSASTARGASSLSEALKRALVALLALAIFVGWAREAINKRRALVR